MRTWLVNGALDSVESRVNCADNIHVTGLWTYHLTLRGIEWIHVWSQLMDLECFSCFIKSLLSALWLVHDSAAVSLRYVLTRDLMTIICVFQFFLLLFLVISWLIHVHSWTSAHLQP